MFFYSYQGFVRLCQIPEQRNLHFEPSASDLCFEDIPINQSIFVGAEKYSRNGFGNSLLEFMHHIHLIFVIKGNIKTFQPFSLIL